MKSVNWLPLFALVLTACATQPRYVLPNGVPVAVGMQTLADCRAEAMAKFPQTVALGNPLFPLAAITTANLWQSYIDDCMDARGFHLCGLHGCRRT